MWRINSFYRDVSRPPGARESRVHPAGLPAQLCQSLSAAGRATSPTSPGTASRPRSSATGTLSGAASSRCARPSAERSWSRIGRIIADSPAAKGETNGLLSLGRSSSPVGALGEWMRGRASSCKTRSCVCSSIAEQAASAKLCASGGDCSRDLVSGRTDQLARMKASRNVALQGVLPRA